MRVKTAFAEADLSQDAIVHILKLYPTYLRWDVEQKLLPAIRCWQQELKSRFPSEFDRIPTLLCMKPEEEREKDAYLTSIGITSPRRLRQRRASMFQQSLNRMQGKVAFLRSCGFTQAQVTSLIEQNPEIIQRAPECIEEFFRVISDMFGCAQDMDALFDVLSSCRRQLLFAGSPTAMHQNFTYFCTCIRTDDKEVQRAWKHGVFKASPSELDIRLDSIAAQLGAHMDTVKRVVRRKPDLSTYLPATVGLRVTQSWIFPWSGQEYVFSSAYPADEKLHLRCSSCKMGVSDSCFAAQP